MMKWIIVIIVLSRLFCTALVGISPVRLGGGGIFNAPVGIPKTVKSDNGDTGQNFKKSKFDSSNLNQVNLPNYAIKPIDTSLLNRDKFRSTSHDLFKQPKRRISKLNQFGSCNFATNLIGTSNMNKDNFEKQNGEISDKSTNTGQVYMAKSLDIPSVNVRHQVPQSGGENKMHLSDSKSAKVRKSKVDAKETKRAENK